MKITNKDFVGDEYYRLLDIACKEADIFDKGKGTAIHKKCLN